MCMTLQSNAQLFFTVAVSVQTLSMLTFDALSAQKGLESGQRMPSLYEL